MGRYWFRAWCVGGSGLPATSVFMFSGCPVNTLMPCAKARVRGAAARDGGGAGRGAMRRTSTGADRRGNGGVRGGDGSAAPRVHVDGGVRWWWAAGGGLQGRGAGVPFGTRTVRAVGGGGGAAPHFSGGHGAWGSGGWGGWGWGASAPLVLQRAKGGGGANKARPPPLAPT